MSQTDAAKGFGGKFGVLKDRQDKVGTIWNQEGGGASGGGGARVRVGPVEGVGPVVRVGLVVELVRWTLGCRAVLLCQ